MAKSTYNTKNLDQRVNAVAPEDGGLGVAGLYRHPEAIDSATGKPAELITTWDPLFGDAQSNAAVQIGFVRVGDAPEGSIKKLDITAATQANESTDSLKGLTARMNQLEGVADRNKELEKQLEDLRKEHQFGAKTDSVAVAETVHQTKVDAAEQVAARGQGDATDEVGPAPTPEDLPEPEQVSQALNTPSSVPNPDEDDDEADDADEADEADDDEPAGEEVSKATPAKTATSKKSKKNSKKGK